MHSISQITALPDDLSELATKAREEGFVFLGRLVHDFGTGENTFSKVGEALFEVREAGRLVAVGGLNIDPYVSSNGIGRVRRLYVDSDSRRKGVGKILMEEIERVARISFTELHLRTNTARGAQFYTRLGYRGVSDQEHFSHFKTL